MHSPIIICNYYEQIILYPEQSRGGLSFRMYSDELTASQSNSEYGTKVLIDSQYPYMVGPGGIMWYRLDTTGTACQVGITDHPTTWITYGASDYNELRLEWVVGDHVESMQLLAELQTDRTSIEMITPIYNATISSITYPDGYQLSESDCYTTPIFTFDAGFR